MVNRPWYQRPARENHGRARRVETSAGVCKEGQQAARVTVTTSTGLARRVTPVGVVLQRRRGMETGIRLVCEGRHSRGSPVPFGVCALPWSREKRFARFQRETRGGNVGRQRTWKILFAEGYRMPGKGETENTAGRPTGAAWRTSRRPTLPLSPTPFPHLSSWPLASLLLNGRKKRSCSFYVSSIDAKSRATSPSFTFDIAKYEPGDVLSRLKRPSRWKKEVPFFRKIIQKYSFFYDNDTSQCFYTIR